jgi:hypothetical protein
MVPVVQRLISAGRYRLHIITHLFAGDIFGGEGIASTDLGQVSAVPLDDRSAGELLGRTCPSGVLCSTSSQSDPSNGELIRAARKAGVPCFALMDHWKGWDRFRSHRGAWDYLPSLLGVIDETSRKRAVKRGIPSSSLCVVGHPHLETLFHTGSSRKENLRGKWGAETTDFIATLFTQAIVEGEGEKRVLYPFLTGERMMAVERLRRVLQNFAAQRGRRLRLFVKPHPREVAQGLKYEAAGIQLLEEGEPLDVALSSDLVMGIDSMILYEAYICGAAVVGLRLDPFRGGIGFSEESPHFFPVVRSEDEFLRFLRSHDWQGERRLRVYPLPKAAVNTCCEVLDEITKFSGVICREALL